MSESILPLGDEYRGDMVEIARGFQRWLDVVRHPDPRQRARADEAWEGLGNFEFSDYLDLDKDEPESQRQEPTTELIREIALRMYAAGEAIEVVRCVECASRAEAARRGKATWREGKTRPWVAELASTVRLPERLPENVNAGKGDWYELRPPMQATG